MIGRTLSHYKVLEKIGAGGMGEVYLATDTKLDREVAVKVLPATFSENKERLARFEREARLLASLNHPNIASIFELEESEGVHFLALEYVPGETLAERIKRGPIPIDEALPLFKQIAEGLEAAHEKGVIHRDLKPANIKITPEGKVKVLDFGLAKAMAGEEPFLDASQSPTLTKDTGLGVILGTAAYMSPEQARGKTVDKRSDIWAFGVVLYEVLTGEKAFKGETVTDILASVIKSEPMWEELPAGTSSGIHRLLRRCLEREPRQRLQDIGDARIEIEEATAVGSDAVLGDIQPAPQATWRTFLPWGVTAAALIASIALWMVGPSIGVDKASQAPTRLSILLSSDQRVAMKSDSPLMAISRNGRRLAWIGVGESERRIYTRTLDDLEVRAISGTEGLDDGFIFFSPDGRLVAFRRDGALWKIPVEGGVGTRLFQSESVTGIWSGDWGDDGTIVLALSDSGLYRIQDTGGEPVVLTTLDEERRELAHERPKILPRLRGALFAVGIGSANDEHIEVLDLNSGKRRPVIENAFMAQYLPSGHLVFSRDGTVFAAPFDLERLAVVGPETPVLSNVQMDSLFSRVAELTVSDNGTLAYMPGGQGFNEQRLAWMDREGEAEFLATPLGVYHEAKLSPDGTQLAVSFNKGHVIHVALYDLSRDVLTQFTFEGSTNQGSAWSPDGSRIAFSSNRAGGNHNPFLKPVGGDTPAVRLLESVKSLYVMSWSPDGYLLAYRERSSSGQYDVWLLPMDEANPRPIPFLITPFNESDASFSPMGGWIAYVSGEEGQPEVFIREVVRDDLGSGLTKKVSRDGGWEPKWSRDGRELFYRSRDGRQLLSVSIRTEPDLEIGEERLVLKELQMPAPQWSTVGGTYDVSPDGERFLMVLENEPPEIMELVVVLNWFEKLKRLVPTN